MMATIRTDMIEVSARTTGAELSGIKTADGVEHLWQADPVFWPRQSPLLFPIVGNLPGKTFTFGGKSYTLDNHGFVRGREFLPVEEKKDRLSFAFTADDASLAIYPFRFTLTAGYAVSGATLTVSWEVRNSDEKTMYFSIGAHPGFRAPLVPGEKREDYDLVFEKKETVKRHFLTTDNVLSGESAVFLDGSDSTAVTPDLFEKGAVVLKDHVSRSVTLRSRKSGRFVRVDFPGFPFLGIWSPKGDCPFVCIEPWHGVMPLADSTRDITKKEGVLSLEAGGKFSTRYTVTVGRS
jgi:galactose mutarotase-like enzyme